MGRRLIYIFLCTIGLFACHSEQSGKYKNVFYWNIASGFTSADPAFARIQANIWIVNQLYNGLIQLDDSLNIKPSIANSWDISEDGLTYTFHLRDDVYFHDDNAFEGGKGRKLTAHDFVYSFNRVIDPKTASPGAWIFFGKIEIDSVTNKGSFSAPNDSTFVITLSKPFRPFLQLLALQYANVVPHEAIEKYGKDFRTHPVGTGPFILKYYDEGEKMVLHKNPSYFEKDNGQQLPYLDAAVISFITSKQNEFFAFVKRELSLMSGLDASFKDNLLTREGKLKEKFEGEFQFEVVPFLNTEYLGILLDPELVKSKPLESKLVRQAISYSIDRKKMIRYLKNSIGKAGIYGFVPPSMLEKRYYSYDINKARELMREAGYPEGKGLGEVHLVTTDQYLEMAVYVQKELENIGIKLVIDNVPPSSLSEMKAQSRAEFFRGSWIADYADPENYLSLFYSKNWSPGGPNYFHYTNTKFDALYEQALREDDDAKRRELYHQMQDIVMGDVPVIVLFYDEVVRLKQNNVRGLEPNPINLISLKRVRMD